MLNYIFSELGEEKQQTCIQEIQKLVQKNTK